MTRIQAIISLLEPAMPTGRNSWSHTQLGGDVLSRDSLRPVQPALQQRCVLRFC